MPSEMRQPKIKDVHAPFRLVEGGREVVRIGGTAGGSAQVMSGLGGRTWALIDAMDGTRTVADITALMSARYPELTPDDVLAGIRQLTAEGHVEDAGAPVPDCLTAGDLARYEGLRHFYGWIDREPRLSPWYWLERLTQARVVLIGAGGTGCAAADALVRSGLGSLHVVEPDIVEEPNLTRQVLYAEADIGRPKLDVALARLRAVNSSACITGSTAPATGPDDILMHAEHSDVVLLCADQPPRLIREWCNEACWKAGTPWVDCGYGGPEIHVQSFVPGKGACWACLVAPNEPRRPVNLASHPEDLTARPVPPHPTTVITAGITGLRAAWHVIALITGIPAYEPGYSESISVLDPAAGSVRIAEHQPGCAVCG